MDLCLQGSGNLHMCSSHTDRNTARILVFWDDLLMFYQAFGVNFVMCFFMHGGVHLLGHVLLLGHIR